MTGPVIGYEPVQPHRPTITDGAWQHCATSDCPVVYYLDTDILTAAGVKTQVANKALDRPTPVCFCFSHTTDGFCACEHLNPTSKCCLTDIHRALKTITTATATV